MTMTNPTCPYCGGEMIARGNEVCEAYWYICPECDAETSIERSPKAALKTALRRASPWHSVKDGLPYNGTLCVVHGHTRYGAGVYDITLYTRAGWTFSRMSYFEVEHWMAVPDAPREGSHENA